MTSQQPVPAGSAPASTSADVEVPAAETVQHGEAPAGAMIPDAQDSGGTAAGAGGSTATPADGADPAVLDVPPVLPEAASDVALETDSLKDRAESAAATGTSPPDEHESIPHAPPNLESVESSDDVLEELTLPSSVEALEPLSVGALLGAEGQLRIVEYLGARGRINVYAALLRESPEREIEVELREGLADHPGLRAEADVLAAVRYAMLLRPHLVHEQDGRLYLAVDAPSGDTLEQVLSGGLTPEQALSLVLQLAQVVRRLHQEGWALLGLTPAEVRLGQPLRVTQLWHAWRIGGELPHALHVAGYSAPELAHGVAVTGKEDVYTLGALLYRALAGAPLSEDGNDIADFPSVIRLPGAPQLLADVLVPAEDRIGLEEMYERLLILRERQAHLPLALEIASATTVGLNPTRPVNEDSCAYATWAAAGAPGASYRALLCVADGMGGMEAGEIASQTAVNVIMHGAAGAAANLLTSRTSGHDDAATADDGPDSWLDPVALIRQAATAVHGAAQGRQLGTTVTCAVVYDGTLVLGHVGDTRAYLLRAGVLSQLTTDHSLVAAMVTSGVISKEEARGHPDSNKVLRSLGSQRALPEGYVDALEATYGQHELALHVGDWILLCSDGIWGSVDDEDIQSAFVGAPDSRTVARMLVDRALNAGAPDNATALVARCVPVTVL